MSFEKPTNSPKDHSDDESLLDTHSRRILAISRMESPNLEDQQYVRAVATNGSKILGDVFADSNTVIPESQQFAQAVHGVIKADHLILETGYVKADEASDMSFQLDLLVNELPYRGDNEERHRPSLNNLLSINKKLVDIDVYDTAYRGNLEDSALYICVMLGETQAANEDIDIMSSLEESIASYEKEA